MKSKKILTIQRKTISRNKFQNMHWASKKKIKNEYEDEVKLQCEENKIGNIKVPAVFMYYFYFKDKRKHDADNYCYVCKMINDGLRYAGVLEEDTIDFIPEIRIKGIRGKEDKIEVYYTSI